MKASLEAAAQLIGAKVYKTSIRECVAVKEAATTGKSIFDYAPKSNAAKDYNEEPVLGIYNMGGIRADLTKGEVTYGDVLDVAPFENKICFVTLNGEQMITLFQQMAKRGGEGVSRGVELVIEGPENDTKMKSVRLHGKEIDPKAEYRIATINYLLEGNDGMPILKEGTNKIAPDDASNNTRFLIMNYFLDKKAKGEIVDSKVEGRIVRIK